MAASRSPRRTVVGTVVSDKMHKTITVREDRLVRHPKYGKYVRRQVVYRAHDEREQAKTGDVVEIAHTRPLSKTKHWRLVGVVRSGRVEAVRGDEDREAAAPPPKQRPQPKPESAESPEATEAPAAGEETSS
jgi:small subunit ribosomal protein S17